MRISIRSLSKGGGTDLRSRSPILAECSPEGRFSFPLRRSPHCILLGYVPPVVLEVSRRKGKYFTYNSLFCVFIERIPTNRDCRLMRYFAITTWNTSPTIVRSNRIFLEEFGVGGDRKIR